MDLNVNFLLLLSILASINILMILQQLVRFGSLSDSGIQDSDWSIESIAILFGTS